MKVENIQEGMYVMYYTYSSLCKVYEEYGEPYIEIQGKQIFLKENKKMIYKVFEQEDIENFIKNFGKSVDK